MQEIVDQLESSLSGKDFYLSLMAALAIPDIAGALEAADGQANGARYIAWFERWVRPHWVDAMWAGLDARMQTPELRAALDAKPSPLTGADCYKFRCSMLHQGSTLHPKSAFDRILFVEPGASSGTMHYNVFNDALLIDVHDFCREVIAGARAWLLAVAADPNYRANAPKSIRRYPEGLPPYIAGVAVIS